MIRSYIQNGVVEKYLLWDPANVELTTTYLSVGLVNGTIELGVGNTFTVPEIGELTFGENNVVVAGPPFIFDASNESQFDF